tara:strand:+ start:3193 stop:3519 length:327 start_codon:yes stop_codon:yes gene_type:complete
MVFTYRRFIMAQFAIEIADADVDRVMDAVSANYNWKADISNPDFDIIEEISETNPETIPNPESKYVFTNRMVRRFLSDHVRSYETRLAKEAATDDLDIVIDISDPLAP